ncbi:hypothetical protein T484DRAFT_1774130 [Baffinella frigidus]|nr:hypothetical protein T484DRAFT_1774130 [Cryptophyta sp. CCMP2293]
MYEVAPFTAQVDLTLLNPPKVSGQPSTPQIYARRHAYPSVTAYDITTAVNGDSWTPTISLHLPKEGTWYVCVHAQKLLTPAPVAVSVAAQVLPHKECVSRTIVLPHTECVSRTIVAKDGSNAKRVTHCTDEYTECVSRTIVAKDGSNAKRVTHCTDEVVKLAVRFDGDASAVSAPGLLSSSNPAGAGAISLPAFAPPKSGKHLHLTGGSIHTIPETISTSSPTLLILPSRAISLPAFVPPNSGKHLHLTGGSIRYFSFTLDPSLAG